MAQHPLSRCSMWLLLVLLQAAGLPARLCEAPGQEALQRALSSRLLALAADPEREPDPSVYLALRLAGEHDLHREQQYLERLQDAFQHRYGRSTDVEWLETGRLALYLLGLRATCSPLEHKLLRSLVTWLKYYLEEDWAGSRRHGHPITSYYQYSLGVLALCVQRKRVREEVIRRLLAAEQHSKFGYSAGSAIDTEAVVAVAFTCLEQERLVGPTLAAELRAAVHGARKRMVEAQGEDGFFGNVYSTPWAMQVFIATNSCEAQAPYGRAMAALLQHVDAFSTAATLAQLLPVLHGHSYLDIASMHCKEELDTLTPISPEPLSELPGNKTVWLVVECPLPSCPELWLYDHPVLVPASATLLDVLRAATEQGPPDFTFDTQDTPQGPYLSGVLGLEAQQQKCTYWQLLTAPSTSLQMGIGDYRPSDGETLILRLTEW
ncbi:transcobalamin-2 isoform X2 [Melopsittacus undulatus]|uniref:transcobalamin-2 isoform X2 n=1 Tax=Melopsittacus undulatus TaxID=13146 RepID=UPI00146A7215|nr:transcobalamin-2 isoform X2 [Melopsittacus undulatus]